MNINDKPMKKSYVELEKDNKELIAKIQKIGQIIDDCDSGIISCEQLFLDLRTILEQE